MVESVKNVEHFKELLAKAGDKLVVVDFTATWCGPCIMIAPVYEIQSKLPENANVVFLKVDVDEAEDVSVHCGIQCMPTFQFYKNGEKVTDFSGANKDKLLENLKALRT
ncbi:thioredoxin-like [Symphorus nematophorus]